MTGSNLGCAAMEVSAVADIEVTIIKRANACVVLFPFRRASEAVGDSARGGRRGAAGDSRFLDAWLVRNEKNCLRVFRRVQVLVGGDLEVHQFVAPGVGDTGDVDRGSAQGGVQVAHIE